MPPTVTEPLVKTVRVIPPTIVIDQTSTVKRQLRTAAYCRVSTDSDEQELSFEAQVAAYTDKIMSNPEWSLVGIFADEGISGTQADKRKDFMRMIRMCRQGKIDQIITKSVSRFARNTVDCLNYVRELKQLGIPVIFEKEGLNTMHMTSEIYISMHGIFAQSESESLSGNVKWGKQKSAEKGNVAISYKNFLGYRKGADGKPEIVPEEAETVVMIYDWFLDGASIRTIKYKLETAGRLSPTGKTTWSESTIRSILTNEKYKGDALLCKTYIVNCITKESKKNTDRPQYYVTNNHPGIQKRTARHLQGRYRKDDKDGIRRWRNARAFSHIRLWVRFYATLPYQKPVQWTGFLLQKLSQYHLKAIRFRLAQTTVRGLRQTGVLFFYVLRSFSLICSHKCGTIMLGK